jgi:thiol-disulfide isomerase/thioredoxin
MSNTKIISGIVVAVIAIGGISAFAMNSNKPAVVEKVMSKTSDVMMKKDDVMMKKDEMMKKSMTPAEMEKMMKDEAMEISKMTPEEKAVFDKMTPAQKEAVVMQKDKMMMQDGVPGDGIMKKNEDPNRPVAQVATTTNAQAVTSTTKTGYIPYSAESITANGDGTNVIFFHAPWCPTCKAGEADINTNLSAIPAKFNILKTDFDTSTALRQKYGVTSQSTFVKVDKDGNKLSIGNGFTKLADIVAFGQK